MSLITIILFFVYTYGLGHAVSFFIKSSDNFFERNLMKIGFGLGVIPLLIVILNLLHIPLDWKIFLLLSLIMPLYTIFKSIKSIKFSFKLTKSNIYIFLVLIFFFLTLFMYIKGSFAYPYLEDDDPWAHAVGIKYVAIEKNVNDPDDYLLYIGPYPPGYDGLMGILHQTSPSLQWTMKFFNSLIISLGIIFFYFFTKNFMKSTNKALIATLILVMIPSYLSHFIWAHSLAMTLLIVALYCLSMIDLDKKWIVPAILVISGICLTQPTKSIKFFFIFIIYIVVKSIYSRKFMIKEFSAFIGGYLLSLIWWATNWKIIIQKKVIVAKTSEISSNIIFKLWDLIKRAFPPWRGTATRAYTFNDFFIAKSQNMINNPVGVGIVLCLLTVLAIIIILITYKNMQKEKRIWITVSLLWLVYAFLGINTVTFNLPIGLFAFRFWMIFALPVSIIAAEGFMFLVEFFKNFMPKILTISVLTILIFLTSGQQKYAVNTAIWWPGQGWTSMEELQGYTWLLNLPVNTKVFSYSGDDIVIGFDKFSCLWCNEIINFRKDLLYRNISEVYSWLKRNKYEYLIFDGMAYKNLGEIFGRNETDELLPKRIDEIVAFEKFQVAHQTKGMVVFKVL